MTPQQVELYQRVQAFRFDADGATYPFARRLAKENGWPGDFTERVIAEYRRFAFLAAAAGHPVSPSDAVDQAWHLHLLYTRSYWDEFCTKVLRKPLHHEPSTGGRGERAKFDDWYARTLQSYRRLFAADPPADIWPAPGAKGKPAEHRRVDVAGHWVIPRPRPRLRLGLAAAAVALPLALVALGCVSRTNSLNASAAAWPFAAGFPMNPFDLRGPQFLAFYFLAFATACGVAWAIRSAARGPSGPIPTALSLDPYSVAYLNGGAVHAVNAAIASLVHRGVALVGVDGTFNLLRPDLPPTDPLERAVCDAAALRPDHQIAVRDLRERVRGALNPITENLERLGLLVADGPARAAVVKALSVALLVPAIGVVKILVGLSRDKPVAFLVISCIGTGALALYWFARRPHRSRKGDALLRGLRSANALLRNPSAGPGPEALALGVAIFGLGVLGGTPLWSLEKSLLPRNGSSTSGCGGSSCSSSCGGGGGSCGGGGGCGGCGGD